MGMVGRDSIADTDPCIDHDGAEVTEIIILNLLSHFIIICMLTTNSLWFEIAIVSILFAWGNMLLGHFEERSSRLRKVVKYLLTLAIVCGLSIAFGRTVAMVVLAVCFLPVLYIHGYYLPK